MPVAEGMVVATDSEDVRTARKMALELLLSDHAGECVAPCAAQCPAGLDIPGFVYGIATGDNRRAMRGHRRAPGAARFAGAHLPASVRAGMPPLRPRPGPGHRRAAPLRGRRSGSAYAAAARAGHRQVGGHRGRRARRPGRGLLSAAQGHACTLFDAHPLPGGMLRYGIPAYRLPKDALDAEIDAIRQLGAQFRMGQRWGEHFTLAGLREQHDAVFVAIGAQRAQGLRCEGEEHALAGRRVSGARGPRQSAAVGRPMSWWSAAATPPWIAPAPPSGWARATCASFIAAAGRRCPA